MTAVVDSHVHVWDLAVRPQPWIDPASMAVIDRSFGAEELERTLAAAGVGAAVLVQVLNRLDETVELLRASRASQMIGGVVGWADLADEDIEARLDELAAAEGGERLVGIRHQALAEPDPASWVRRREVARGVRALGRRNLVCDLMLGPAHLAAAATALAPLDRVTFVLDHAGKPPIADGWDQPAARQWAQDITGLARHENVLCKLSGLTVMAAPGWASADLAPFVEHLVEHFGPDRILFGSDWPVSLRAGSYDETLAAARELTAQLSSGEREAILGTNARRVYRLPTPQPAVGGVPV